MKLQEPRTLTNPAHTHNTDYTWGVQRGLARSLICTSELLPCFPQRRQSLCFTRSQIKSRLCRRAVRPAECPCQKKTAPSFSQSKRPTGFMKKLNEQKNEIKSCKSQSKTPVKPRVGLMTLSHEGNHKPVNLRDEMSTNTQREKLYPSWSVSVSKDPRVLCRIRDVSV